MIGMAQSLLDAAQETSSRQQKMHQREINKLREQIAALRRQSSASRPEPTPLEGRRTRSSYELFFRVPDSSAAADDGKNEYGVSNWGRGMGSGPMRMRLSARATNRGASCKSYKK